MKKLITIVAIGFALVFGAEMAVLKVQLDQASSQTCNGPQGADTARCALTDESVP